MTTTVTERPILFSGPMVRAIIGGRKTQTRRIVKPQPHSKHLGYMAVEGGALLNGPDYPDGDDDFVKCPYGQVGDRLWVRETWRPTIDNKSMCCIQYQADESIRWQLNDYNGEGDPIATRPHRHPMQRVGKVGPPWRPSIHMPRWASRITLEITGVRVERLNDISNADIIAEGITASGKAVKMPDGSYAQAGRYEGKASTVRQLFSMLWTDINGAGSWSANPWVWVLEFKRLP